MRQAPVNTGQAALCAQAPDPSAAERRYTRLAADTEALQALQASPLKLQAGVIALLGYSDFLSHYLLGRVRQLPTLLTQPGTESAAACADITALRHYKYRELFRITCRDLGGVWTCEQVLTALSKLSETILQRTLELAGEAQPTSALPCVLALGKLGGGELNFSSDVDLVFLCDDLDAAALHDAMGTLQSYTRMLDARTPEGFLYRVDLRLRPWGKAGPLLLSLDATENYLAGNIRGWERLAWLRMRPVAGTLSLGDELAQRIQPFLYPRSLDTEELQEWIDVKQKMQDQRTRPGCWDVKAGEGGIRDLEFFVQILQSLYGGRRSELRTPSTLKALAGMSPLGLLSAAEVTQIRTAYLYLRALENRLQMINERQTHHLPPEAAARRRLARAMGTPDPGEFEAHLEAHRVVVSSYFERILPELSRVCTDGA